MKMETIKQLERQKFEIEKKIKELKNKDFILIKCKRLKKEFRIYKWNKQIKDFPIPKGFDFAEYSDFVYLYDNDLIELEEYPVEYFTKNQSKKNIENGWKLSGLYRGRSLYLDAGSRDLAYSDGSGRVVFVRDLK